jgi:hypothetical protein
MVNEMHNYVQKILLILLVKKGNIEPILWFKKENILQLLTMDASGPFTL